MICGTCKREYTERTEVVSIFGSEVCLHDKQIDDYKAMGTMSMKNDEVGNVRVQKYGKNKTEQKYIDTAHKRGDTVIRASDGLLRAIEKN